MEPLGWPKIPTTQEMVTSCKGQCSPVIPAPIRGTTLHRRKHWKSGNRRLFIHVHLGIHLFHRGAVCLGLFLEGSPWVVLKGNQKANHHFEGSPKKTHTHTHTQTRKNLEVRNRPKKRLQFAIEFAQKGKEGCPEIELVSWEDQPTM